MISAQGRPALRQPVAKQRTAFTIVEIIVASQIVSIALLGVYGLLRQASHTHAESAAEWESRHHVAVVLEHLCSSVESSMWVGDLPAIEALKLEDRDGWSLTCTAFRGSGRRPGNLGSGLFRIRYEFRADTAQGGVLEMRSRKYAGSKDLSVPPNAKPVEERMLWETIEPIVIAEGIDEISIHYRRADSEGNWQDQWEADYARATARIRVRVAAEQQERVVSQNVSPTGDPTE